MYALYSIVVDGNETLTKSVSYEAWETVTALPSNGACEKTPNVFLVCPSYKFDQNCASICILSLHAAVQLAVFVAEL